MSRAKIALAAVWVMLVLAGCSRSPFQPLSAESIQSIHIWYDADDEEMNPDITLTQEEIAEFISLYNQSHYGGKATGEGGTPPFGARVTMQNGDLMVNPFDTSERFEVVHSKADFYLKNAALYDWIRQHIQDESSSAT